MFEQPALKTLGREVARVGRLRAALGLLGWDQETMMPKAGGSQRAAVIGDLTEVAHRMATSPELGDQLAAAEEEASQATDSKAGAFVREVRRGYDRSCKVPAALAEEIARTASETQATWAEARREDDFPRFQPFLEKLLALKCQEAEAIGGDAPLYDTMLDAYEPHCTAERVQSLVDEVKPRLVRLVQEFAPKSAKTPPLQGGFSVEAQRDFGLSVIKRMGFDFDRGRVDLSTHPFCSGMNANDVRLTTRYSEDSLESLFTLVHEAGHGLYEQGLDPEWAGTPLGASVSLGIHESQSRLWENLVARGSSFWSHFLPSLKESFPGRFEGVELPEVLRMMNRVEPSLIRVEADEVTYNLHVMLRFELEMDLVNGRVAVGDLPGVWRARMKEYLGVEPPTDREGVLQDIHWSFGAFGYFPTYFLGNLFSAQFYEAASKAMPDLEAQIARGELLPLREWLQENIHRHGSRYPALELCERVTGKPLEASLFGDYLESKLTTLYGAS